MKLVWTLLPVKAMILENPDDLINILIKRNLPDSQMVKTVDCSERTDRKIRISTMLYSNAEAVRPTYIVLWHLT